MDPEKLNSQVRQRNMSDAGLSVMESSSPNASLYSHYASFASAYHAFGSTAVFPPQYNISSMFGGLGSLSPSLNQPYPSPLAAESKSSSRRKSHTVSHHTPSSRRSESETKLCSSTPIYTNPSSGVTITPINYESGSMNSIARHNGRAVSSSPSSICSITSETTCGKDSSQTDLYGYHLPIKVPSREISASQNSSKASKSATKHSKERPKNSTTVKNCTKHSEISSDSSDEELRSSSRHYPFNASTERTRTSESFDKASFRSSSPLSTPPSLEPSTDASLGPLNLSTKTHTVVEDCLQPPVLLPVISPKQRKIHHRPKNQNKIHDSLNTQKDSIEGGYLVSPGMQRSNAKHRSKKESLSQEMNEHKYADLAHMSLKPSSNKSKSSAPQVVISSASPQHTQTSTPNVVTITALPYVNRGISLLTGAPVTMSPITDVTSPSKSVSGECASPKKSGYSTLDNSGSTSFNSSLMDHSFGTMFSKHDTSRKNEKSMTSKGTDDTKKLSAKFRTTEDETSGDETSEENSSDESNSSSRSDSSSSNSESDSDSSESDTTEQSHINSGQSTPMSITSTSHKRPIHDDSSSSASPIKRRRILMDEKELRIPLEHGWRRQTKIRTFSFSGVRGVVVYFAPCGKKLKTYPEVIRYLDKNGITDITRENFSFSTKVNIGEFLEPVDGENECVPLGEQEVIARIDEIRTCKRRRRSAHHNEELGMHVEESKLRSRGFKLQRRMKHHESGRIPGVKLQKKMQREQALIAAKEAKQLRAMEVKRHKEHLRFLRQKEKYERQEQLKLEKEMKTQQMIEARKKRQEELEKQRIEEAMRKAKEREIKRQQAVMLKEQELQKRREMLIMVDLERERRRQHMLLVKALEAHKKQEERERVKEERKAAKKLVREKKMEQRRLELQVLREMRKPVDDMEIGDAEPLPTLNRIPGVKLTGKAFADILMILEFLHNFGETLGFDMHHLPTLNTLQMGILNHEESEEELISTIHHLLTCAIEDPGTVSDTKRLNCLHQSLKEMDITSLTVSEVLRIYVQAQVGEDNEMSCWLKEHNFLALDPLQKTTILAFICNELLCSRAICRQIENNIELVNNIRRDRWVVEGKLRKLKTLLNKKTIANKSHAASDKNQSGNQDELKDTTKEQEDEDESANESDGSNDNVDADEQEEESGLSCEELKKNIDRLNKNGNQCRNKLLKANQQLRAISFGQDRFKRRYWVLPYAGGVFVEGMESAELLDDEKPPDNVDDSEDKTPESPPNETDIHSIPKREPDKNSTDDEAQSTTGDLGSEDKLDSEPPSVKVEDNLFLQKPEELGKLSDYIHNSIGTSLQALKCSSNNSGSGNPPYSSAGVNSAVNFNGSLSTSGKEGGGTHSNHYKCDSPFFNGNCMNLPSFKQNAFCAETFRSACQKSEANLKPWFSLLPRMPCDETSITRIHNSKTSANSISKYSPYSAFNMYNSNIPSFASLHMGVINGSPSSFFPGQQSMLPSSAISSPAPPDSPSGGSVGNGSGIETPNKPTDQLPSLDMCVTINHSALLDKLHQHAVAQPIPLELQRGWWRITDSNQLKNCMHMLHQRGIRERMLYKQLEKYEDFACSSCGKGNTEAVDLDITDLDRKISQMPGGAPEMDEENKWNPDVELRVDLALLDHIEGFEEKINNASMQKKGWKPTPKITADRKLEFTPACLKSKKESEDDEQSILEICIQKLLQLETNIERRYIKSPLGYSTLTYAIAASLDESTEEDSSLTEEVPSALLQWREAVSEATTSAQLALCMTLLENSLAWDKSVMKASCQFCNSGDNEAKLLLCDGCDKGYHMYCFKPKMDSIPDGDWFCNECHNKASGDRVCMVCSKKGKNLCICDKCPKAFHIDCLNPPLARLPKGKWLCSHCTEKSPKSKSKSSSNSRSSSSSKKKKKKTESPAAAEKQEKKPVTEKAPASADKKKNEIAEKAKSLIDLSAFGTIIKDLEDHEGSWPFLLPVNTKQFPSYRKVIKKPMDLRTIKNKVEEKSYKSNDEFVTDIRLIFDNCETFNEDDSPVGKAGHTLRAFFETKWSEITGT